MFNPIFSIILPIYKVEKYISKCISTCCNQVGISFDKYELILVNDSTPDDSIDIAQKELDKYPGIQYQIIHRPNGGLSAARNTGIEASTGKYIWFVDSDDYISEKALNILSTYIKEDAYDIIRFQHITVLRNGIQESNNTTMTNPIRCVGYDILRHHNFLSAWNAIYKRSFINTNALRFKEGRIWEDSEFNIRAYSLASNCLEISDPLYFYIRREHSISDSKATPQSINSRLKNVDDLIEFFKYEKDSYKLSIINNHLMSSIIAAISGLKEMGKKELLPFRQEIQCKRKIYLSLAKYSSNKKIWLIIWLYGYFPQVIETLLSYKMQRTIIKSQQLQTR